MSKTKNETLPAALAAENNLAVVPEMDLNAWGSNEMTGKDLVIPRLNLAQGQSKIVIAGNARPGDFYETDGTILGNIKDKPIEFVPFLMRKKWINNKWVAAKNGTGKFEYHSQEPMTPYNQDLPWDYELEEDGQILRMRRVYTMDFYILIPGKTLPYVTSFASSSAKAGKELATIMFTTNRLENLPPAGKVIEMAGKIDEKDGNSFNVRTIRVKGKVDPADLGAAFNFFKFINSGKTVDAEPTEGEF